MSLHRYSLTPSKSFSVEKLNVSRSLGDSSGGRRQSSGLGVSEERVDPIVILVGNDHEISLSRNIETAGMLSSRESMAVVLEKTRPLVSVEGTEAVMSTVSNHDMLVIRSDHDVSSMRPEAEVVRVEAL